MNKQSLLFLPFHVLACRQSLLLQFFCCPLLQCSIKMDDSMKINNTVDLYTTDSREMIQEK